MIVKEYRITLPLSLEEYQIAQLYTVVDASRNNTGGGDGVQIIKNEKFENNTVFNGYSSGQYTLKVYHLGHRVPGVIRLFIPSPRLTLVEEAWNAYPYCKTTLTNPGTDRIMIKIESIHLADRGETENPLGLSQDLLANREVVKIDIANDPVDEEDLKQLYDPTTFKSKKTSRGPLSNNWIKKVHPVMTCYKLVTVEFRYFGVQSRVETYIQEMERRVFLNFHRQLFCNMDNWYGLSLAEIRHEEDLLVEQLKQQLDDGNVRGALFKPSI